MASMSERSSVPGAPKAAVPIGTLFLYGCGAGVAGVAAMTMGEKIEQFFTSRPNSLVPGKTLGSLIGMSPQTDGGMWRLNMAMHYGQGALAGVIRAVMTSYGFRGPFSDFMFIGIRLMIDQTLENWTGVGAPPCSPSITSEMDRLPRELVDAILVHCVDCGSKNDVLRLRLVCHMFNATLKPYACRTLGLEFSRLSKTSSRTRPQLHALNTIGQHCKSLYIDLMVLRDEMEVEFLNSVFSRAPSMVEFCQALQTKYCMGESSFTEEEYLETLDTLLSACCDIERLRLNLPFQLVGSHCNAATRILAITLKAFANRPDEESAELNTMVLENVTDIAICRLWTNPVDVMNIMRVVELLEHLVLTIRRYEFEPLRVGLFGVCLWNLIEDAQLLKSLCLVGADHEDRPPRGLKLTKSWQMPIEEWRAHALPAPRVIHSYLTRLELKRIELDPDAFTKFADNFGSTLQELYLNEVYLKTEKSDGWNEDLTKVLWVGLPNKRPTEDCRWVAMTLRTSARNLRICRASFLAYDYYLGEDVHHVGDSPPHPDFDLVDPCGLGRSLSQRFVEIVTGVQQKPTPSGNPIEYFALDPTSDPFSLQLTPRTRTMGVVEYDTNAYQTAVANTTSEWQKSIDGVFTNCNNNTLDELHYIAETACEGMNELHRRRAE
ncbi:hypothetical protein HJFPF1_01582 [Paramyrothecium foliicola]|nr:hypothetical protein HJFPF1_01582 [Paramyrothecium foliicola]